MSAKLWNIDNPGDFQYKVDLLTKLTLRGCKTVWGWQRLTEAVQLCVSCLRGRPDNLHLSLSTMRGLDMSV